MEWNFLVLRWIPQPRSAESLVCSFISSGYISSAEVICQVFHNKVPQTQWLNNRNVLSQFRRLEVQDQCVPRAGTPETVRENVPCILQMLASGALLAILGFPWVETDHPLPSCPCGGLLGCLSVSKFSSFHTDTHNIKLGTHPIPVWSYLIISAATLYRVLRKYVLRSLQMSV
jgi:hypothetical protein